MKNVVITFDEALHLNVLRFAKSHDFSFRREVREMLKYITNKASKNYQNYVRSDIKSDIGNDIESDIKSDIKSDIIKEERREREESSPRTPYKEEKGKQEETSSLVSGARARKAECGEFNTLNQIPSWEMVMECVNAKFCPKPPEALVREWFNRNEASGWHDGGDNPIHNWVNNLQSFIFWYAKNKALADPDRVPDARKRRKRIEIDNRRGSNFLEATDEQRKELNNACE